MKHKDPKPTKVSLVEDALSKADDFMSMKQLCEATGCTPNQVSAALHHLQKHKATEAVVDAQQVLHWFITRETDTRLRRQETRTPEDKPRKARGVRKTTPNYGTAS